MSKPRVPKELRALAAQAEAAGWKIVLLANGHTQWIPPQGQIVVIGGAHKTADPRALRNARSMLRAQGLVIEGR